MSHYKVFVFVSGSVSAYKAGEVVSTLVKKGHQVRVGLTSSALNFVGPSTFEGLTGHPVLTDQFTSGAAMEHIELTRWADVMLVAPATANTLNRLSQGLADDLLGSAFLAWPKNKPIVFAPAMNNHMLSHPTVESSIAKLRHMGHTVLDTEKGVLACGELGLGRLTHPQAIVLQTLHRCGAQKTEEPMKVLITAGGSHEPIDRIRHIGNKSSGQTGVTIASHLYSLGHQVHLLLSENSTIESHLPDTEKYGSFCDFQEKIEHTLLNNTYDAIVHLAALSDFSVDFKKSQGLADSSKKISSDTDVTLKLKRNPKVIDRLKTLAPNSTLVGFKLTDSQDFSLRKEKVFHLFQSSQADFIVHNDWSEMISGRHIFTTYSKSGSIVSTCDQASALGRSLEKILVQFKKKTLVDRTTVPPLANKSGGSNDLMP